MSKSVQRLRASRLNQLPFVSSFFETALPQIIKTRMAIIPAKDVHRAFKNYSGVVCSRFRTLLALRLNQLPPLLVQVILEEVVEIVTALSLIPAKEEQGI